MSQTFIRLPAVMAKTGLGRSAIYARITPNPKRPNSYDPSFPLPVNLGGRAVAWLETEIDAWVARRVEVSRKVALSHRLDDTERR